MTDDGMVMISLSTSTWGSAQVISMPAPSETSTPTDRDERHRQRPAMVIRRATREATVEVGPTDALHPSGRLDIYL